MGSPFSKRIWRAIQDLAIAWSCLGEFDPALQDRLMWQYGLAEIDQRKLQFHLMLDELF